VTECPHGRDIELPVDFDAEILATPFVESSSPPDENRWGRRALGWRYCRERTWYNPTSSPSVATNRVPAIPLSV